MEVPDVNSLTIYKFTYGFIMGMQATSQFPGACVQQFDVMIRDVNTTYNEVFTAYLPWNWFNFLDRLRIVLVDYSTLQQ